MKLVTLIAPLLAGCVPAEEALPTDANAWTWQADDPALAERWLGTCNQGGVRPGQCPTGSTCVVRRYDDLQIPDFNDNPAMFVDRAWCQATDATLRVETLPATPGATMAVALHLVDSDGDDRAPVVGTALVTAIEPTLHRRETAEVGPDATARLELEAGDWHVQVTRAATVAGSAVADAEDDPLPWGIPAGWLHVARPGTVDVEVPAARIRLAIDAPVADTPGSFAFTSPDATVTLNPSVVGREIESPTLGPGPWSVFWEERDTVASGTEGLLAPDEVRRATFRIATREITLLPDDAPLPPGQTRDATDIQLAFGEAGTRRTAFGYFGDVFGGKASEVMSIPAGRWDVWWNGRGNDRPSLDGWLKFGSDVLLPDRIAAKLPAAVQPMQLTWSDYSADYDFSVWKVFADGSWSLSPLSLPWVWSGEGELWLVGDCREDRPGPLTHLDGVWGADDVVEAELSAVEVTFEGELGVDLWSAVLTRLDPETLEPYAPQPFYIDHDQRPELGCYAWPESTLLMFPGTYLLSGTTERIVEILEPSTFELYAAPTTKLVLEADGRPWADATAQTQYGAIEVTDLTERTERTGRQPKSYAFGVAGAPTIVEDLTGATALTWVCDPDDGCTAEATPERTVLVDYMRLTRDAPP